MSEQIRVLTEREKVREKISVWLESSKNYIHVIKELMGNSNDLIISGIGDKINFELKEDNRTFIFEDNCTGIPVEGKASNGIDNYIAIFETLFAGSKYDQVAATVGTNGVFLCVLTMSSKYVKYTIGRPNGKVYQIEYVEGIRQYDLKEIGSTNKTFTRIECMLDDKVYDNPIFNYEDIKEIAKYQAAISIATISTKYQNEENIYHYNNGIEGYLQDIIEDKPIVDIIRIKKDLKHYVDKKERDDEINIDFAFTFSNTNNKITHIELLNGSLLDLHGTPFDGITVGLKNAINRKIRELNLYSKNEKQIINEDVLISLNHALDLKSLLTEYTNQSKRSSLSEHYKIVLQKEIEEFMNIYFIENEIEAKKICNQILINKRAREKSSKMMENVKKKLSEEITVFNKPQGLLDCKSKDINKNRLFIAEGQSAKSGLIMGRDRNIDAIFPIRGKILNCLKADYSKIFDNDVVLNIIRILGCGVEIKTKENKEFTKFDINKCKYGKIIIATDSDKDGMNIRALILTLFYRLMPTLIKEGRVYLVEAPLFEIECEGQTYYAVTDREKDNIIKSLGSKKIEIGRNKGIGETSAEATAATIMNPEYKGLYKITMNDIKKAEESFELFMGDKVAPRKEYIIENFNKYCDENILIDKEYSSTKEAGEFIIENEMPYATYTITERALPQIEDGLKPSQRRGVYTLKKANIIHNKPRLKSSNVEGRVMALHPHSGIYPTLARMARPDTLNIPFLDSKGAMGIHNSDDINESAGRYTELRLSEISQEYFRDMDKSIVPMLDNYDNTLKEPKYLPVTFPAILCNTTIGIATGFSSNICPYNFEDVCNNAAKVMLGQDSDIMIPDFSTGGYIVNNKDVFKKLHNTGLGTLKQRGKYKIVGNEIIFTELPYMSTVEKIESEIIELMANNTLKEVINVSNDTDKNGLALSVTFKKNTNTDLLIDKLYKLTNLENNFSCNFTVLHNDRPVVLGVKGILEKWCEFRLNTAKKSIQYDLNKIQDEIHLYEGLIKIVNDLKEVADIIMDTENDKDTIETLINNFGLDGIQAKYISELQLKKLNKDNINKQYNKLKSLNDMCEDLNSYLENENKLREKLANELIELTKKYPMDRKSELLDIANSKPIEDILIEDYNLNIVLSKEGYMKKVRLTSLRGASEYKFKDGDILLSIRQTSNKNDLLIFTDKQNCYKLKIHEIQDHKPSVLGLYLPSHLQLDEDEHIIDIIPTDYSEEILIAYENGKVARVPLSSYKTKTNRTKLSNATYSENIAGIHIYEDTKYILATEDKALIFKAKDIPLKTSRNTQGITVMKHSNMGKVVKFKKVSDCKLDTQSRYIAEGNGKAGRKIYSRDII